MPARPFSPTSPIEPQTLANPPRFSRRRAWEVHLGQVSLTAEEAVITMTA